MLSTMITCCPSYSFRAENRMAWQCPASSSSSSSRCSTRRLVRRDDQQEVRDAPRCSREDAGRITASSSGQVLPATMTFFPADHCRGTGWPACAPRRCGWRPDHTGYRRWPPSAGASGGRTPNASTSAFDTVRMPVDAVVDVMVEAEGEGKRRCVCRRMVALAMIIGMPRRRSSQMWFGQISYRTITATSGRTRSRNRRALRWVSNGR